MQAEYKPTLTDAIRDGRPTLEVVLAIAVRIPSNYANHLFHTPVDGMFAGRAWAD